MDISGFDKLLQEKLTATRRKEEEVAAASQRIQNKFNPLNYNNVEHVDGDTFRLRDNPEHKFRIQNDPSYGVDTFESDPRVYENDPERLKNHRRNYAKLTGRPEWSITINELVDRGKVQAEQVRQRMSDLGQQGRLGYQSNGVDDYGRELVQLYDTETGENVYGQHSGREQNASYDSKFNAGQRLDDLFSGETGRYDAFQGGRGVKGTVKDLGVSLAAGTGRMASGLAQGALTLIGGNGPVVDRFFNAVNEGLDNFQDWGLSNEALARNARVDRNRARNIEAFDVRKKAYLSQGYTDGEASLFAGAEEFQDTVADLLTEPGYIIDKTVESLPYMIGVAGAGRAAVGQATKLLSKNVARSIKKAGGSSEQARQSVRRYLASDQGQKILGTVASTTGVSTIGVTEALTTSTDVYNSVVNMSPEEANKSEQYRALRQEGMSHKQAVESLGTAAFDSTFLPAMLIAGAASLITGAGGWEARLFTRRAGASAVDRVAGTSTSKAIAEGIDNFRIGKGLTDKVVGGSVRNVGRFARFAGPAGASEATEEAIQSGSQEFLTQLANFNAGLGPAPGPGIGAAAGEGAAIGFASGAGIQSVSGGLKKLANMDLRKSGLDRINRISDAVTPVDATGHVGGSVDQAQESVQNVTPERAQQTLTELREQFNRDDAAMMNELVQRKHQIDEVAKRARENGELSVEDQKFLDEIQGAYVQTLDRAASNIQQRENVTEYTPQEKAILQAAIAADTPSVRNMAQDNEQLDRIYSQTRRTLTAIDEQEVKSIEGAGAAAEVDPRLTAKVAAEKMGDGFAVINGKRYPGLKAHFRLISEAIADGQQDEIAKRMQAFGYFFASQARKVARLEAFLGGTPEQQAKNKEFKYQKGTTEAYYDLLVDELETMKATRDAMDSLNKAWAGKEAKTLEDVKVPARRTFEAVGEGATQQSAATKTSNQPKETTAPKGRTLSAVGEETENEVSTEQEPAQDDVGQSPPNRTARTLTAVDEEASTDGQPVSQGTEGTPQSAPAESEGGTSSNAQPASAPVRPRRKKRGGNVVANVDPNAPIKLNEGQQKAFNAVMSFLADKTRKTFAVIGSAGTGKTTIINKVLAQFKKDQPGRSVVLSAPTHRAASVIQSTNKGKSVATIHKILGLKGSPDLANYDPNKLEFKRDKYAEVLMPFQGVLIVDESSMINDALYDTLTAMAKDYGTQIIFLGDMAQLGPVNQATDSKALLNTDGKAELTQVMRAKNSQLLDESVFVREEGGFSYENDMDSDGNGVLYMDSRSDFLTKAVEYFKSPAFQENPLLVRVLTYTNAAVPVINDQVRKLLYGDNVPAILEGEVLMAYDSYGEDVRNSLDYRIDKITPRGNATVFDGAVVPVIEVEMTSLFEGTKVVVQMYDPRMPAEKKQELIKSVADMARKAGEQYKTGNSSIWKRYFKEKARFATMFPIERTNAKQPPRTFDYGYAHTIHKSQGGTYTNIMIHDDDINRARDMTDRERLRYVAVTRAEKGAYVLTSQEILPQEEGVESAAPEQATQPVPEPAPEPTPRATPVPSEEEIEQEGVPVETGPVNVWAGTNQNSVLSNLAKRPFTYKGLLFQSVEHAYQTWKSGLFNEDIYDNPAWKKGNVKIQSRLKPNTKNNWNIRLMEALMAASFRQNQPARAALLQTGERPITHNNPSGRTDIWTEEFPRLLTNVRDSLRNGTRVAAPAPVEQATSDIVYEEKDYRAALINIWQNSKNKLNQQLAEILLKALEGRKIKVLVLDKKSYLDYIQKHGDAVMRAKPPDAIWLGNRQEVVLQKEYRNSNVLEEAFLHELVHAAINGWMTRPKTSTREKNLHNSITRLHQEILDRVAELRRANPTDKRYEDVHERLKENKEEWITYAWTNKLTQEVLREIDMGGQMSALDKVIRAIQKMLGLNGTTALDHVLTASQQIFSETEGETGRTAREGATYTPSPEAVEQARKELEALENEETLEAEADDRVQAEAQPERSTESEAEAAAKKIAANDYYWDVLREVKRAQRMLSEGKITPEEVEFLDPNLQSKYQELLQDNTADGALAQLETRIEDRLDRSVPRTQVDTSRLKLPEIIRQAKEIREKGRTAAASKVISKAESFATESGFSRIQRWIGGKWSSAEGFIQRIRNALAKIGLPISVDEGFRQASKTAKSLITAVPNLHEVLDNPLARRKLYDELGLTPAEERAFEQFRQFRNEMAEALAQSLSPLDRLNVTSRGNKVQNPIQFKDGNELEKMPVHLLTDSTGILDPAVVTAIAYENMNWLTGDGQSLVNTIDDVIDILGLPENTRELTPRQKRLHSAGTLRRNVAESLGRSIYRHLNIAAQQGPNIAPNLDERMEQALGTLALRAMLVSGRVQAIQFSGPEFLAMKLGDEVLEDTIPEQYQTPVNFIRAMSEEGRKEASGTKGRRRDDRFTPTFANFELLNNARPGRTVFTRLFGVSGVVKEPLLSAPTEDNVPKKALRSLTVLSKKLRGAIRSQQARAWTTETSMIETLRRFESIEDFLAAGHEYEQNMDRVHALEKDAVTARNRGLVTAVENAFKWFDENNTADFFFTYFVSKTGRTHVGSTFINPQASKIHRFIFRQKGWTKSVNLTGDARLLNNFKIAVALGMDLKIDGKGVDKLTQEEIIEAIDKYMDSDDVRKGLAILAKDGPISLRGEANKPLRDLLGIGKEGTHTLAALLAWQEYVNARDSGAKSFTTSLPMEVDGVTNGFAAGLLQTPPVDPEMLERVKDLSRATGMFYDDDTVRSFAQWLKDPNNKDNYIAAARLMATNLKDAMERDPEVAEIVRENLGPDVAKLMDQKTGRNFAKNPLMIIAYGAGFTSVRRNMVNRLISDIYNDLAKITERPEAERMAATVDLLNRAVRTMNVGQRMRFRQLEQSLKDYQIKQQYEVADIERMIANGKIIDKETGEPVTDLYGFVQNFEFGQNYDKDQYNKYDQANLAVALDAAYGTALEGSLSTMLAGIRSIRDKYNHAVMLMNAIFNIDFRRRIANMERKSGRVVGRQQRAELLAQMHREGLVPSIRTAYSESLDENLELTAYQYDLLEDEVVRLVHPRKGNIFRRLYEALDPTIAPDTASTLNNLTVRNPSMDVGVAGIVGTIHSLDGTNSADVFGQFGVLNVFDAWVMSIDDMDTVPEHGNKRFAQQNREYDLGQELLRSVRRMTVLMQPGEGRLSAAQREEVENLLYTAMDEANQIDRSEGSEMPDDPAGLYNYILNTLNFTVPRVTETRNKMLGSLVLSSQFSHDKGAYQVPNDERETPVAILGDPLDYVLEVATAQKIDDKARTLADNMAETGNFTRAVADWLQKEGTRPNEALRVIARTFEYAGLDGAQAIYDLISMLEPHLNNIKIIKVGRTEDGGLGEYRRGEIVIDYQRILEFNEKAEVPANILETLFHEIVHGATEEALIELEQNNPNLLKDLNALATAAWTELRNKKRSALEEDVFQALTYQDDLVLRVSEFMAWTLTTVQQTPESFGLLFGSSATLQSARTALGQTLTLGNTTNPIIRSSRDRVNNDLFDNSEEQLLESDKLWTNMAAMEELDNAIDPAEASAYKTFVSAVMTGILIPGLATLQLPTYLKVGVDPDGTKNIGEVERGSDKNTLRVQAARGKLSNNGGMTNQEVFAHELYHAVTGYTIASDTKVRAELRKIYEYAKERITWEDFMPAEEDIAGDRAAVEAAAKERYDYIFGQVEFSEKDERGNREPLWDQLQEFAAIGLSNKPFALALSRIDAPTAAEPLWDGNILSFLVNLISRGLEILRGQTLGTRRAQNSADALFKLSQQIVTINQQALARKYDKQGHKAMWHNAVDERAASWITRTLDRAQEKLRLSEEEKRSNGTIRKYIRMGTHAALTLRTEEQQKANREFMRHLGVNKSSWLSEVISEVLPYNKDDRGGVEGKRGFLDLLRHSKVLIDIARQRAIEHTRKYLLSTFDKNRRHTRGERLAMTNVLIRTDITALLRHNKERTHRDLHRMLQNESLVAAEIVKLERMLATELAKQGATKVAQMYKRQIDSLANYQVFGEMTERNGMKNAHNIVRQYNLVRVEDRVPISDPAALDGIVDQLATLRALQITPRADIDKALNIINHEMAREEDNGFFNLLGMIENHRVASLQDNFDNNPVKTRKGYVYDITDGDISLEVIMDTPNERRRMEDLGYQRIGEVNEDRFDGSAPYKRVLYRGYRGANTWQKAVVSITSEQRQGTSLFEVAGYDPKVSAYWRGTMIRKNHAEALKQFGNGGRIAPSEVIAIPVLNDAGRIIDYTYEMSLGARQQYLKNDRHNDYFDQVLPRMFGSIPDRVGTKKINKETAELIYNEWEAFKDSPEHNLVKITRYGTPREKDMFNVIPGEMKAELAHLFRGTEFVDNKGRLIGLPLRDEAVNLVLGFRKLSILDLPSGRGDGRKLIRGQKATFVARTAERVWQEVMQLVRIKMAIINPTVVVGNLSSNFGILLAEGIPPRYIMDKTSEAIRGMRQYQRDIASVDRLQREIGVAQTHGRPVAALIKERERLKAELRHNPVGHLVQEGLFTSIVEDVSSDEDTYREWIVGSALDKLKGPFPGRAVQLAKEAYMVPGSNAFNMAIAATQYGDFIGRYVKFKYDTEVKKVAEHEAIANALASFIYYDMPQNRWLQLMNDNGFLMFTKFFLRIQPVIARLFQENPGKATGVLLAQQALMSPFDENIGKYALFAGGDHRFEAIPLLHLEKLEPTHPSLFQWLWPIGL